MLMNNLNQFNLRLKTTQNINILLGKKSMNKKLKNIAVVLSATLAISLASCQKSSTPEPSAGSGLPAEDQQLQARTKQLAVETLGLKLEGSVDAGHRDNFSGLRTENVTFTQRLDSRTFIAYDKRFSDTAKTGIYKDSDEAVTSILNDSHSQRSTLYIFIRRVC